MNNKSRDDPRGGAQDEVTASESKAATPETGPVSEGAALPQEADKPAEELPTDETKKTKKRRKKRGTYLPTSQVGKLSLRFHSEQKDALIEMAARNHRSLNASLMLIAYEFLADLDAERAEYTERNSRGWRLRGPIETEIRSIEEVFDPEESLNQQTPLQFRADAVVVKRLKQLAIDLKRPSTSSLFRAIVERHLDKHRND